MTLRLLVFDPATGTRLPTVACLRFWDLSLLHILVHKFSVYHTNYYTVFGFRVWGSGFMDERCRMLMSISSISPTVVRLVQ